ncbi:MAG: four-carbon acid sugar kinase family protein [Vicinamibacterales bacterium]|nr:four-carbon acid sugar kinase family protein [Vicinamibacterales bacterium]
MTLRIGIVADDLTGASDTAVQFVRAGWDTELQLRPRDTRASVVAVTTDSRNLPARVAADAVTSAVKRLRDAGINRLYKKIDSTLRGHVRDEVQAALESWSPRAIAIVCPAFPASGRTVVGGEVRVNNVPVAETAFRNDPVTPVTESHLPALLGAPSVAAPPGETPADFAARLQRSGRTVVVDAVTDDDLKRLAEAVALIGGDAIPVGSAGLAQHLALIWRAAEQPAPAVVIVTSLQDVARRQAAAVEAAGAFRYEPGPDELIDDRAWARASARILDRLDESNSTLLLTATMDRSRDLPSTLIPNRFAELAARVIAHRPRGSIAGLAVTGGDGARALVDALGATGVALRDEVMTGVPIGTLLGGVAEGLPVVTKAGGFGSENALVLAVRAIRDRRFA